MIDLRPNRANTRIESKDPTIPIILIIIGNVASRRGNTPDIKSPEYWVTEGPPINGCWTAKNMAVNTATLLFGDRCYFYYYFFLLKDNNISFNDIFFLILLVTGFN